MSPCFTYGHPQAVGTQPLANYKFLLFQVQMCREERIPITCPTLVSVLRIIKTAPAVKTFLMHLESRPRLIINLNTSGNQGRMTDPERNRPRHMNVIRSNCRNIASGVEGVNLRLTGLR